MSDSTVEQTKETCTVIVLNFTEREKKMLATISRLKQTQEFHYTRK